MCAGGARFFFDGVQGPLPSSLSWRPPLIKRRQDRGQDQDQDKEKDQDKTKTKNKTLLHGGGYSSFFSRGLGEVEVGMPILLQHWGK